MNKAIITLSLLCIQESAPRPIVPSATSPLRATEVEGRMVKLINTTHSDAAFGDLATAYVLAGSKNCLNAQTLLTVDNGLLSAGNIEC